MLLPEASLDTLVDQLRQLPAGDRNAILALLGPAERKSLRTRMRGAPAPSEPRSPYSADIAACVAAAKADDPTRMTAAARRALLDAQPVAIVEARPPSLFETLLGGARP